VNRAVTQMDQVVQSNAAQTEELTSTAQSLTAQADQLKALVARFKLAEESSGREEAQAPAAKPLPEPLLNAPVARSERRPYANGSALHNPQPFEEF
jgi:methyl-accepting chemotaxis protein